MHSTSLFKTPSGQSQLLTIYSMNDS